MKTKNLFLVLAALPVFLTAQEYKPSIHVNKGEQYNYKTNIRTESTQSMGGRDMKVNAEVNAVLKNVVEESSLEGGAVVLSTVWDIATKANVGGQDTTIVMAGKVGNEYRVSVNKTGNVLKKEKSAESQGSPANGSELNAGPGNTFLFIEFPDKSLKTGDKWVKEKTDTVQQPSLGGNLIIHSKNEYTLGGESKVNNMKVLAVNYTSNLEITGTGSMMGADISIEGTGVRNGTSNFDPASGVVQNDKSKLEMDMTISISGPQNMTIPVSQKLDMTTEIIK